MFFDVEIVFFVVAAAGRAAGYGGRASGGRRCWRLARFEGGQICARGGQGRVPGVASGERTGFLSSYRVAKVLGVVEVEDGRICARVGGCPRHDERGKRSASFLLRTEADEIGFISLFFFSPVYVEEVDSGVYKKSASGQ